jgi:diacylglycerol kinase family enzyme
MNLLPRALYGDRSWRDALADTLAHPKIRGLSGGKAEGRPFFCVAILGSPSLWAKAREAGRKGDLVEVARRSITAARRSESETIDYVFGESLRGVAAAVAVTCPAVSKVMSEGDLMLEAAALDPRTAAAVFGLAFHAVFDDWRNDASVSRAKVKEVRVTGRGQVPILLDGESVEMGRRVHISFEPLAFRALVPAESLERTCQ